MKLEENDERISKSITRKNFESFLEKQDLKKKEEKGQIDWNERKKDWLRLGRLNWLISFAHFSDPSYLSRSVLRYSEKTCHPKISQRRKDAE